MGAASLLPCEVICEVLHKTDKLAPTRGQATAPVLHNCARGRRAGLKGGFQAEGRRSYLSVLRRLVMSSDGSLSPPGDMCQVAMFQRFCTRSIGCACVVIVPICSPTTVHGCKTFFPRPSMLPEDGSGLQVGIGPDSLVAQLMRALVALPRSTYQADISASV